MTHNTRLHFMRILRRTDHYIRFYIISYESYEGGIAMRPWILPEPKSDGLISGTITGSIPLRLGLFHALGLNCCIRAGVVRIGTRYESLPWLLHKSCHDGELNCSFCDDITTSNVGTDPGNEDVARESREKEEFYIFIIILFIKNFILSKLS